MRKNMKKWIAMSLALVMAVGCLTACGKESSKSDDSKNASSKGGSEAGTKKVLDDLGGIKVKIGDWYYTEEKAETEYAKKTEQYRKDIQKKYNFEMTRKNSYAYADMQEQYVQGVMSNNPACSIYYLYQEKVSQPLMRGLMKNLKTVKTLDLTEEKWNPLVNELMNIGGGQYGMTVEQEPRGGLFYNKRLFKDAGIDPELPYELQASGEWTWAKFEELCKKLTKDTNNDGKTDQYALASFSKEFLPIVAATNNAGFIGRNEDGTYKNITGTNEFMDAMKWGVGLLEKGYIMPKPEGANWDWFIAAFRDCDVAMQCAETYKTSSFDDMEDEFGFVMFPKNQKNKDAEMKTIPNDNVVVIPSCFDDATAEKIGQVFDLYTEPTPGYTQDDEWRETYSKKFKDVRAVDETLTMMREEKYKSISYLPLISDIDYGDFCYSVYARSATPQKKLDELTPKWNSKIDDMNKKYASFKAK